MNGCFGDTFVYDNLVFRVYTNYHPEKSFIAYPIYKIEKNNILINIRSDKQIIKRYLKKLPNSNITLHLIKKSKIKKYFSCLNIGNKLEGSLLKDFNYIKKNLNKLGINKVGLSGYAHLKSFGLYKKEDETTDLDFVVFGKKNCLKLKSKLKSLYDKNFISYENNPKLIYNRRKKTTPYKISLLSAKEFEAKKPIGILKGRHINITPTYKIVSPLFSFNNKIKNLGIISTTVKIQDTKNAYSVPGFYKIIGKSGGITLNYLVTNFFFYALCQRKGAVFDVRGNLIECDTINKKDHILSLENWGDYKKYYMNFVSD